MSSNKEQQAVIFSFPDYANAANRLAEHTGLPIEAVQCHRFPDGESRLTLSSTIPSKIIFCRSLDNPNEKLVELILAADAARNLGAREIFLVAPYLCYMRQDMAFSPGEVVSQQAIGRLLEQYFDVVITVDPHLHRISRLEQVMHCKHAVALSAMPEIAKYIQQHHPDAYLLGPDEESEQWVAAVAASTGQPYIVGTKHRQGDRDVQVSIPEQDIEAREVLIIDDIASTARTLIETVKALKPLNPGKISVLVTHALFVEDAADILADQGVSTIISTDSIQHPSNRIELAPLLSNCLLTLLND